MTDAELLAENGRTGSEATFAELVSRHRPWVYSTARRIVRDPHTADDVTQAVFVLLAGKARMLAGHPRLGGWLLRATRHTANRALRATARRSRREAWAAALRWQWASRGSPSAGWDRLAGVLDEQVAALRRSDREAILLRYYQSKEMADVAAALGVSEAAARKRVTRAVATLRERLRDRTGLDAPAVPLAAWLATVTRPTKIPTPSPTALAWPHSGWATPRWPALAFGSAVAVAVGVVAVVVLATPPATRRSPAPLAPAPIIRAEPTPTDMTGRILDATGMPVAGATVTVSRWEGNVGVPPRSKPPVARSDAAGVYHLPAVTRSADVGAAGGSPVAWADGNGAGASDVILFIPGQRDIRLPPPADLNLTFHRPDGRPAAGMPVRVVAAYWRARPRPPFNDVVPDGLNDRPPFRQVTDASGSCTFTGLPRGTEIRLAIDDARFAQMDRDRTFPLPDNQSAADETIDLTTAASISGRVTFSPTGRPVAGIGVSAWSPGGHQETDTVETAADGTYTLGQLAGGHYSVEVATNSGYWIVKRMSDQWTSVAVPGVLAEPDHHVTGCDLKLIHGVVLTGRVVDEEGQPVADVDVGSEADPSHGNDLGQMVGTDAAGAFSFRLPPGKATIVICNALPAGFARTDASSRTVTVREGDNPLVVLRVRRR